MVAFAKEYASTEAHRAKVGLPAQSPARSQNRAECFFAQASARAGHGAPATRLHAGENGRFHYDACQGASLAQSGQRYGEGKWKTQTTRTQRTNEFLRDAGKLTFEVAGAAGQEAKKGSFRGEKGVIS